MALEFSSVSALLSRVGSDHRAHTRSLASVLAGAIAGRLNDRTNKIDSRHGARARVGVVKARRTADGNTGYHVTISQNILADVPEAKRKQIQQHQSAVKSQLASKNGVMGLLASGGVD